MKLLDALATAALWLAFGTSRLAWLARFVLALLLVAAFARCTLFSGVQVRRMRWRTLARVRPGPGFATPLEMWLRFGRVAAVFRWGRQMRPSWPWWKRLATIRVTQFALRLGRGPYFRVCYYDGTRQTLYVAPPREGKTGWLSDRLIDHPGAAIVHETRPDHLELTIGYRTRGGRPYWIFNPEGVGDYPSTFGWDLIGACADPVEAVLIAADLVGAVANVGEMQWWVEKAQTALAAGLNAAGVLSDPAGGAVGGLASQLHGAAHGDMNAVWRWAYGDRRLIQAVHGHPDVSEALISALTELDREGKTADSIKITMSKALAWMAIPPLAAVVTGPDARPFDVAAFIESRGTIYMISPSGDDAPGAPLFRAFTSYVHRQAKRYSQLRDPRKLDPMLLFALDELDKCPVNAPAWLADSAGFGIQIALVVHSLGQLRDKYGDAGLATVWNTCQIKFFLAGNHDTDMLQDLSILGGALPGGSERGINPSVPPEFITRLPDWRAYVVCRSQSPLVVKFRPAWRRLRNRVRLAPPMPYLGGPAYAKLTIREGAADELAGVLTGDTIPATRPGWPDPRGNGGRAHPDDN